MWCENIYQIRSRFVALLLLDQSCLLVVVLAFPLLSFHLIKFHRFTISNTSWYDIIKEGSIYIRILFIITISIEATLNYTADSAGKIFSNLPTLYRYRCIFREPLTFLTLKYKSGWRLHSMVNFRNRQIRS